MTLPLSVTKPSRSCGWPLSFVNSLATLAHAIVITSTGSGNFPIVVTSLLWSQMQTKVFAAALDHRQLAGDFVSAIDIERDVVHIVEIDYRNTTVLFP